jgi:arsenic resistance protein ArsH
VSDLPNIDFSVIDVPDLGRREPGKLSTHPPRILLL